MHHDPSTIFDILFYDMPFVAEASDEIVFFGAFLNPDRFKRPRLNFSLAYLEKSKFRALTHHQGMDIKVQLH